MFVCSAHGHLPSLPLAQPLLTRALDQPMLHAQFVDGGCENCQFLSMEGDDSRVVEFTTPNFSG